MIPIEQHLQRILAAVTPLSPVSVSLPEALGLVLAEDVVCAVALPGFTNSAMDGYAVVAADLVGASSDSPVTLPVRGDIPAGDTAQHEMVPGECWRIMTGAPLPEGADSIVPVELTDGGTTLVEIHEPVASGASVRYAGEDVQAGEVVLKAGVRLLPHQVAVVAAAGLASVSVVPAPRVAVITTGDELVFAGKPLQHGQIHDSNGVMLGAAVEAAGFVSASISHVRDDDPLADIVAGLASDVDAIITSGGVSAGAYEPVKDAFPTGSAVTFDKVAMQPGKPQGFGLIGSDPGVPLFALPGNPVSSLVSFEAFVLPALRKMSGRSDAPVSLRATAVGGWRTPKARTQLARVLLTRGVDGWEIGPSGGQASHILGGLSAANAIAVIPADIEEVRVGDEVEVRLLPGEELPS